MSVRDTTIPDFETDAISPTGRIFPIARKPRHVFACGQRTFSRSAFFLAVIPRFCCRAAVDRPRAPFLVTMSLYNLRIRRQERTAGWQFCFLPRLTILSKSGRTLGHRNSCRNLSAPITSMHSSPYRCGWVIILRSCLYVDDPFRDQYRVGHLSWPVPDAYRLWCGLGQAQVQLWRDHL